MTHKPSTCSTSKHQSFTIYKSTALARVLAKGAPHKHYTSLSTLPYINAKEPFKKELAPKVTKWCTPKSVMPHSNHCEQTSSLNAKCSVCYQYNFTCYELCKLQIASVNILVHGSANMKEKRNNEWLSMFKPLQRLNNFMLQLLRHAHFGSCMRSTEYTANQPWLSPVVITCA